MRCNKCGTELPDDSLFCTECGASLTETETSTVFTDDEPTSILPRLEEVIADNEETLSLTQEQVMLLNDEPAEILSSSDGTDFNEKEALPPMMHSPSENHEPAAPVTSADTNSFNDNSDTIQLSIPQETPDTRRFSREGRNEETLPPPPGIIPPPQNNTPVPPPVQPDAQEKQTAGKKVGGGRIFGASLVSFLGMIFLLLFSVVLSVKTGANGSMIRNRAEALDADTTLTAEFDGKELYKALYGSFGFRTATNNTADEAAFKRFLIDADFCGYAGEAAKNYLDFIIDGEGDDPSISSEDFVNDFIKANKKSAVKEFEYDFTDDDYKLLQSNLDKDDFTESLDIREWSREVGFDVGRLSYLFSYITIGIIAALVLLILIWIAFIVDKRAKHITGFFGSIFTSVGTIVFLSGLTVLVGSAIAFTYTHNVCFYLSEKLLLPLSIMFLIVGGAEFIIGFIFRKVRKGIIRKEKKAAPIAENR